MSLICHPIKTIQKLTFYLKPSFTSITKEIEINEDDYILCYEREGSWLNCHTRLFSGWVRSNMLRPSCLPYSYIINDELPFDAQIRLRNKPSDDDNTITLTINPGVIVYVIDIKDNWLKINFNGKEVWLKKQVNEETILAIPVIPKLYEKGPTIPQGCSLRLRETPNDNGNISRLSQSDYFLGIQTQGNWLQVIGHPRQQISNTLPSPEWMLTKTPDGTILLRESSLNVEYKCIQKNISQEAVLRIREVPEIDGLEVGSITYYDVLPVYFIDELWAYSLTDIWDGFVLTCSGKTEFLETLIPNYPIESVKVSIKEKVEGNFF